MKWGFLLFKEVLVISCFLFFLSSLASGDILRVVLNGIAVLVGVHLVNEHIKQMRNAPTGEQERREHRDVDQ